MYSAGADKLGFVTNSTHRLIITSAGNVGIGDFSPVRTLDVNGQVFAELGILVNGDNSSLSSVSYGFWNDENTGLHHNTNDSISLATAGVSRLTVSSTGNIGIDKTDPDARLQVNGDVIIGGPGGTIDNVSGDGDLYVKDVLEVDGVTFTSTIRSTGGVEATPDYSFDGDSNTGIFTPATDTLGFVTSSSTKMTILSTGNVGIGDTGPSTNLHVAESNTDTVPGFEIEQLSTGDAAMQFTIASDSYAVGIDNSDSDVFKISYSSTTGGAVLGTNTRMSIDSIGGFGIGTDTVPSTLKMVIADDIPRLAFHNNDADPNDTGEDDEIGGIYFGGTYDGSTYDYGALIVSEVAGDWTSSNRGADIYFKTQSATSGLLRRMVITAAGNVGIGTGTSSVSHNLQVIGTAGLSTGTAWTNTSDIRLKNIDGQYEYGLDEIVKLNTVRFHYKDDNSQGLPSDVPLIGFIAQEVQPVFPEAVHEGNDGYLNFDIHPINVAMVNAVKQLKHKLDTKDNEIAMLKAYICSKDPEAAFCD